MSFSNKNQFSESSAGTCLGVFAQCVCVRGQHVHQRQHLFTSKKTTVFSNCLLFCIGACINWSNSERLTFWLYKKTLQRNLNVLYVVVFFLFFALVGRFLFACYFRSLCCNMVWLWQTPKALALSWPSSQPQFMMRRRGLCRACGALSHLLAPTQDGALNLPGSCSLQLSSHHSWEQKNTGESIT